jgi:ABC-type dipeptide/oligopeptide/nickel transport system permease subunit
VNATRAETPRGHLAEWSDLAPRALMNRLAAPRALHQPRLGLVGAIIIAGFIIIALFPQTFAPYSPTALVGKPLEKPSATFWLGTNDLGQDLLSELIWATRLSLTISVAASLIAVVLGALIGIVAGYLTGWVDQILMRVTDLVIVFPFLPLMILLAAYLGPSPFNVMAVIAFVSWAGPARVIRSQVLSLRNEQYIEAARAVGATRARIVRRHLLPGAATIISSQFALVASNSILAEASLSFLGLGDPTSKSWGTMLYFAQARGAFLTGSWLWWVLPPGILITLAILGLVLVSHALEERFEPALAARSRA